MFLVHPNGINLIHKGRAKVNVSVKCLVLVKMYGNNPRKLFVRIIRNSDVRMNEFPLFSFPFLRIVFISWCNLFISSLTIILFREGINQILDGISKSPIAVRYELGLKSITYRWFVNPQSGPGFITKGPATGIVFHTEPQRRNLVKKSVNCSVIDSSKCCPMKT